MHISDGKVENKDLMNKGLRRFLYQVFRHNQQNYLETET